MTETSVATTAAVKLLLQQQQSATAAATNGTLGGLLGASGSANYTELAMQISEDDELRLLNFPAKSEDLQTAIPLTIIFALLLFTGCIGNLCTAIVIARPRNKYMHTATNYYLFSLAISDFLFLILGLPQEMYTLWRRYPYAFGEPVCIIRGYLSEASTYASILTISAFTVERYVAICHPLWAHTMSQLPRAVTSIVLIWALAAICAIPPAAELGIVTQRGPISNRTLEQSAQCATKRTIYENMFALSAVIFFIVPMIIVTVLYILIAIELRRSSRMNSMNSHSHSHNSRKQLSSHQYQHQHQCHNHNRNYNNQVAQRNVQLQLQLPSNHNRQPSNWLVKASAASTTTTLRCPSSVTNLATTVEAHNEINPRASSALGTELATSGELTHNLGAPLNGYATDESARSRWRRVGTILRAFQYFWAPTRAGDQGSPQRMWLGHQPCECHLEGSQCQLSRGDSQDVEYKPIRGLCYHESLINYTQNGRRKRRKAPKSRLTRRTMTLDCDNATMAATNRNPNRLLMSSCSASNLKSGHKVSKQPPKRHNIIITTTMATSATEHSNNDSANEAANNKNDNNNNPSAENQSTPISDDAITSSQQQRSISQPSGSSAQKALQWPQLGQLQYHQHNHHRLHSHQDLNHNHGHNNIHLHHHQHHHHHHNHSHQRKSQAASSKKSVIRMLVAVVVSFFICWLPFHAQRLLASYLTKDENQNQFLLDIYLKLTYISGVMYYLSSTINPLLYQLMSAKFRLAFKETFKCSLFKCAIFSKAKHSDYSPTNSLRHTCCNSQFNSSLQLHKTMSQTLVTSPSQMLVARTPNSSIAGQSFDCRQAGKQKFSFETPTPVDERKQLHLSDLIVMQNCACLLNDNDDYDEAPRGGGQKPPTFRSRFGGIIAKLPFMAIHGRSKPSDVDVETRSGRQASCRCSCCCHQQRRQQQEHQQQQPASPNPRSNELNNQTRVEINVNTEDCPVEDGNHQEAAPLLLNTESQGVRLDQHNQKHLASMAIEQEAPSDPKMANLIRPSESVDSSLSAGMELASQNDIMMNGNGSSSNTSGSPVDMMLTASTCSATKPEQKSLDGQSKKVFATNRLVDRVATTNNMIVRQPKVRRNSLVLGNKGLQFNFAQSTNRMIGGRRKLSIGSHKMTNSSSIEFDGISSCASSFTLNSNSTANSHSHTHFASNPLISLAHSNHNHISPNSKINFNANINDSKIEAGRNFVLPVACDM